MAVKLKLFETCDYALISQDNKLSIIGMFDQIFVQNLPARHPKIVIAAVTQGKPDSEHTIRFQILSPTGETVTQQPSDLAMKIGPSGKANVLVEIGNIPLPEAGEYVLECHIDGKQAETRTLRVLRLEGRSGQPTAPDTSKPVN